MPEAEIEDVEKEEVKQQSKKVKQEKKTKAKQSPKSKKQQFRVNFSIAPKFIETWKKTHGPDDGSPPLPRSKDRFIYGVGASLTQVIRLTH